jgi:NADPH:quinone reductase-like Zn-dependent oxidoreductase
MKATVIDGYGGSERLVVRDLPDPAPPGPGQVLVRVRAASVNPIDWKIRQGKLRLVRRARFPLVLGYDLAGEVVAIGPEVTRFEPGDEVFGGLDPRSPGGSYAELTLAREGELAPKPAALTFEAAAALPVAGVTALQALRGKGELVAGEKVLVNGASGGVGHLAVQIAVALGARVTAVASRRNLDFVRGLGAHEVIDYEEEDFTGRDDEWDVIFDAVGTRTYRDAEPALSRNGGIYVSTQVSPRLVIDVALTTFGGLLGQKKRARAILAKPKTEDLAVLAHLAERGGLRPEIQQVFALEELAQAHDLSESEHVRGKLVVRVALPGP